MPSCFRMAALMTRNVIASLFVIIYTSICLGGGTLGWIFISPTAGIVYGIFSVSAALVYIVFWGRNVFGIRAFSDPDCRLIFSPAERKELESEGKTVIRLVFISDTHGYHDQLTIPDGDVLVHCGDFTHEGRLSQIRAFNRWLGALPHKHKLVIGGNHDLTLDPRIYKEDWAVWHARKETDQPGEEVARQLLTNCTAYLNNSGVTVEGVRFFGCPACPCVPGHRMAFNYQRGSSALRSQYQNIPRSGVDVLITHSPPRGHCDRSFFGPRVGSALLKEAVAELKPSIHAFGHIHESYGLACTSSTVFVNASIVTLLHQPINAPVVVDIVHCEPQCDTAREDTGHEEVDTTLPQPSQGIRRRAVTPEPHVDFK